jgi:biotin carboxyl carrier protein
MTTRWLVRPTPATRLDGDDDQVVDLAAASAPLAADTIGAVRRQPDGRVVAEAVVDGWRFELELEDADRAELRARATRGRAASEGAAPDTANGPAEIRAMIPGRVEGVRVAEGDTVAAGQTLLVVEAMTMQNELRAPRDGSVQRVAIAAGETIELGDLLVVLG